MAKLTGKVLYIYPTQQLTSKSGNAFTKRDFVIAMQSFDRDTGEATIDAENTPQLTITGDRCAQLDNISVGELVTVDFFVRGRRYRDEQNKEKIITDINVTSVRSKDPKVLIVSKDPTPSATTTAPTAYYSGTDNPPAPNPPSKSDDLPF